MATPNCHELPSTDYLSYKTYEETKKYILDRVSARYPGPFDIGIVCGSGLGGLSKLLSGDIIELDYKDIPHFGTSTVPGHAGKLIFGTLEGKNVICMVGRKHMYEGHAPIRTSFPIRIMKMLGTHTLITTNAAGGLNADFSVGDIMFIIDHISLVGIGGLHPLVGKNVEEFGDRFPAMSDAYDYDLRSLAIRSAIDVGLTENQFWEGTYGYVSGPSFETRAEARFLRNNGADVVGMSTVPEVIAARHCGMKVLAMSLVTNKVAIGPVRRAKEAVIESMGILSTSPTKVTEFSHDEHVKANHLEVLETSNNRAMDMQRLVSRIVSSL